MLFTHEVDQVGGVAGVEHREALGQPERRRVPAQRAVRDRVERAAHDPAAASLRGALGAREQRLGPVGHLPRRAPGERQRHDAFGGNPASDEPGHPRGEGGRLPGAGAGEDPELLALECGCGLLLFVESFERWEHMFDPSDRR